MMDGRSGGQENRSMSESRRDHLENHGKNPSGR